MSRDSRDVESFGAGVAGNCESPNVVAGSFT